MDFVGTFFAFLLPRILIHTVAILAIGWGLGCFKNR